MADSYTTKKINELATVTSADDSDIMMVGKTSNGTTSAITKANFLKELSAEVSSQASDIAQNASDISSLNSALAALPEIQTGSVTVTVSGTGANESVNVTFPSAFSQRPMVCVSPRSSYPSQVYASVATDGATTTGFTLYYGRSSGSGNFNVTWIAIAD